MLPSHSGDNSIVVEIFLKRCILIISSLSKLNAVFWFYSSFYFRKKQCDKTLNKKPQQIYLSPQTKIFQSEACSSRILWLEV